MKKVLFGILFFGFLNASAQTLQFSRTMLVTTADTVPQNKVWKISSILYSSDLPNPVTTNQGYGYYSSANHQIVIDGQNISSRSFRSAGGNNHASTVVWNIALPIWLEAGKILASGSGVYAISIIEFTIIP